LRLFARTGGIAEGPGSIFAAGILAAMTVSAEPSAPARAPQQRVPDFFIVGQHKSGTTALYEMLRRHPQIYMPDVKEPRYFADDLRFQFEPEPSSQPPRTYEQYLSLFAPARPDQRVGEASPSYLKSQTAARAIARVAPAARIVAILREPASFVRSLQLQLLQEHVETETDLRRAVANERVTRGGREVLRYSDHVHYVEQLRRYHAVFSPEQVLVLIYDDFRNDNEATVRQVLRFLDVDDTMPIEVLDANPTVSVRAVRLDRLARKMYSASGLASALSTTLKALSTERMRRRLVRTLRRRVLYAAPPPPDEDAMIELRARYRPEVVALSEYLGRDLVGLWGYDRLG
jgi:Sulfotransferase family